LRVRHAGGRKIEAIIQTALRDKEKWERGSLDALSSDMFKIGG